MGLSELTNLYQFRDAPGINAIRLEYSNSDLLAGTTKTVSIKFSHTLVQQ